MAFKKIISNEFRLVSLTLLDEDDSRYMSSVKIVREAYSKSVDHGDPLDILLREEALDELP